MDCLLEEHFVALQQAVNIVAGFTPEQYLRPVQALDDRPAGQVVADLTGRYKALLLGMGQGVVNYEEEPLDMEVATDPNYAAAVLRGIIMGLEQFDEFLLDRSLRTRMHPDAQDYREFTVRQELEYLLTLTSRTVGRMEQNQ